MAELGATSPSECGLAIALPLDLAEVESALVGGPYCDYVSRGAALGSAEKFWNAGLSKVAHAIASLVNRSRQMGIDVVLRARREDLARLFASRRVVTVLAHWRGPEITPRDITQTPLAFAQRLAADKAETASLLRMGLPASWHDRLENARDPREQASRLAELLDQRLRRTPALSPPPAGTTWHMDPETLRHFNRDCLDRWVPDAVVAGNRFELFDGLHTPDAIAQCVPTAWTGIADLSSCQSAQLIEQIKQGRADRIVVANERETNPLLRVAVLQVVYDLLAEAPRNYADVRLAVAVELSRKAHQT